LNEVAVDAAENGVWSITINRPERRNALGVAAVAAFHAALDQVEAAGPEGARAVVIAGAEGDFCTGADLHERRGMSAEEKRAHARGLAGLVRRVYELPAPTIARIGGYALGGGCELALACDFRILSESAIVGLPEARIGAFPGAGGGSLLARIAGPAVAKDLIFTGRKLEATEAERMGIASRLVPDDALEEETAALAACVAANGPIGVRFAKQAIDRGGDGPIATSFAFEVAAGQVVLSSEDYLEGLASFAERRPAVFRGA
jgi:enoyl-CoA hydratase